MILVELRLENYKQYAGSQLIEFPPEGAVAIIGNNGVGKTTLFEAIEWCLYNPRQIPNDELPPRGGVGDTRVTLVLEDPRDRSRYVVERSRRRRGVDAEIYLQDQPESPIVKGTRDVTEYVTNRLFGLSHRAFVSTFFTRQKELSFFGELRDTERRREVAQLLGFETIRAAQSIISDGRTEARNDYQALDRQYQEESKDRDFPAELVGAQTAIATAAEMERQASLQSEQSEAAHQLARQELERWTSLERRYATLSQEIERLSGELNTAQANRRHAEEQLDRLAGLELSRRELLPRAEAEPALRADLLRHEADQARFLHAQSLEESVTRAVRMTDATAERAAGLVRSVATNGYPVDGWTWGDDDWVNLEPAINRLLSTVDLLDPRREARQAEALRALADAALQRDEARKKADRYRLRLAEVERKIHDVLNAGDPRAELEAKSQQREQLREQAQAAVSTGREITARRQELLDTIGAIRETAKQPECPTCRRPLSPKDATIAIAPLEAQVEVLDAQLDLARRTKGEVDQLVAQLDRERAQVQDRLTALQDLESRRATGLDLVAETSAEAEGREATCAQLLEQLGRSAVPTRQEVDDVLHRADQLKSISSQRASLVHLRAQLEEATATRASATLERETIGPVEYEPEAHREVITSLEAARAAVARLAQIEAELARRPEYESQLAAATDTGTRLNQMLTEAKAGRDALHFDRTKLEQAERDERETLALAREAERAAATSRNQLDKAVRDRADIIAERERLSNLARRAEVRRREHDELDRMYREFSRFDQYVAQLVTPQLADYTGELLAEVTDHKYDQVVFDENYGVRIFDGPEDFPIDQFSGGERDVVALCARLALSRLIGAQAAHPPQFLVLDEVFGSLDAERRAHVLGALLKLAGTDGPFRQLFIISHVDDVRLSPALDEVWRVHEVDGASKVENLARAGIVEEV